MDNQYLAEGQFKQQANFAWVVSTHLDRMSQHCWNTQLYYNDIEHLVNMLFTYSDEDFEKKIKKIDFNIKNSLKSDFRGGKVKDEERIKELMMEKFRLTCKLAYRNGLLPTKTIEGDINEADL